MRGYEFKITLLNVKEPVIRVLHFPQDYSFNLIHQGIQTGMGWKDLEDYYFLIGNKVVGEMDYGIEGCEFVFSDRFSLKDFAQKRFKYYYDGEVWVHEIQVEEISYSKEYPEVVEYEGNCPIEELGGPEFHVELLSSNPRRIPDFDLEETNHLLKISFKE